MAAQGVSDLLLHNFPENGVKFLLHNPGNLEDLLRLLAAMTKYRQIVGVTNEGGGIGAEQPRPSGSLMVGVIALDRAAPIVRRIVRIVRRKRTQAEGRQQFVFHQIDHRPRRVALQQCDR